MLKVTQITQDQAILDGAKAYWERAPHNKRQKMIDEITKEMRGENPNVTAAEVLEQSMLCAYMVGWVGDHQ